MKELQANVFVDTNARVPAEGCRYIIFHGPTKRYFRYNPTIDQCNLTNARDCNRTTQYVLCKDNIFHQITDQTNYVKWPKVELKINYDQMTDQGQDLMIKRQYSATIWIYQIWGIPMMKVPIWKKSRKRKEKPKWEKKNKQIRKRIKIPWKKCAESKNKKL